MKKIMVRLKGDRGQSLNPHQPFPLGELGKYYPTHTPRHRRAVLEAVQAVVYSGANSVLMLGGTRLDVVQRSETVGAGE